MRREPSISAGLGGKDFQQVELECGQIDLLAADLHRSPGNIDGDISKRKRIVGHSSIRRYLDRLGLRAVEDGLTRHTATLASR